MDRKLQKAFQSTPALLSTEVSQGSERKDERRLKYCTAIFSAVATEKPEYQEKNHFRELDYDQSFRLTNSFRPHLRFDIYKERGRWRRPSPSPSYECWPRAALGRSDSRSALADSWNKLNGQHDTEMKTTTLLSYYELSSAEIKNLVIGVPEDFFKDLISCWPCLDKEVNRGVIILLDPS